MCMFKKICVLLFLLLVVFLSVSSVTASSEQQYNETEVEYIANIDKSIDVSIDDEVRDNVADELVVDTNITLSLQQGEHIELVFNELFDYPDCYINDNDIIYWDSSDEMYFYVHVPINAIGYYAVNVGMNTLTVKCEGYHPFIVEKVSYNLIQFKTMDSNGTKYPEYYSYKFNLNISKKQEKTISITNIVGEYYDSRIECYNCKIFFKLSSIDDFFYEKGVQLIISNKNGEIYYNKFVPFDLEDEYNNHFSIDFNNIFDAVEERCKFHPGVYDLTLVNYDGTNDTWSYEFKKEQWNITFGYNILNNSVLFQFNRSTFIEDYLEFNLIIKLGSITKSFSDVDILWGDGNFTVLFDNLEDGVYDVVIEIPGNKWIEDFSYTTRIEIGNSSGVPDDNDDIIEENNVTNDTVVVFNNVTGNSDGNSSILSQGNSSGSNSSNVSGSDGEEQFKESSDVDFNNEHVSDYGDLELTGSIHSADSAKSYEISKNQKNEDKSNNNEYFVALMFFIFFMVGFFRFKRVYY